MEMEDFLENNQIFIRLMDRLGHQFTRSELLFQAFMHASFVNEHADIALKNNERLEFLGDAVLDLVVSHMLMERFQDAHEGDLSKYRAMIVDECGLYQVAKELELGKYLFLGKGEEQCLGREKPSILANTMEALIGAIYLDAGFDRAMEIIHRLFRPLFEKLGTQKIANDYKSLLQEFTQKAMKALPTYSLINERGPAHDKIFTVELSLNGKILAVCEGKNKKEAEQKAAGKAYSCLQEKTNI